MPKIPENYLDGVFYLYDSVEAAQAGDKFGGTGFFVSIDAKNAPGKGFVYAVSNWHVAVRGGFSVIRVNTVDGGTEIIELVPEDWEFDPVVGYDVAAVPVSFPDQTKIKFTLIPDDAFVPKERFSSSTKNPFGVGDDVFMVGRFIDHDGGPTNQPAVRFGHISINPSPLPSLHGKTVDTICLDTNSRTGFSGSPVFVYRTMTSDLHHLTTADLDGKLIMAQRPILMLLGIHVSQFHEWWEYNDDEVSEEVERLGKAQIRGMSGMTQVAPAWAIRHILDLPVFKKKRDATDLALGLKNSGGLATNPDGGEAA